MNLIEKAIIFATQAHSGQVRKNGTTPYILHPIEAASIAAAITDDPEILAAVILHDTVEDTDVTAEDIRREFGSRVADIVAGDTEEAEDDLPREETWMERKKNSLAVLSQSSLEIKIMWLSDKLSNMRSFCRMYRLEGDAMWRHFHQQDKKIQEWYYRAIADQLSELKDTAAYQEYLDGVNTVFGRNQDEEELR